MYYAHLYRELADVLENSPALQNRGLVGEIVLLSALFVLLVLYIFLVIKIRRDKKK